MRTGVAPAGATVAHYKASAWTPSPAPTTSPPPCPVPFDAWLLPLRDHGTKPLADVLKYAIGYAEHGHAPVERFTETVETVRELFETEWTSSAEVYLPDGHPPRPGELFRNLALAATWKRLLAEAAGAGTEAQIDAARRSGAPGSVAEALVRWSGRPTPDTPAASATPALPTAADLAAGWSASREAPATYDWNGWTVARRPPWSQGPRPCSSNLALLPPELPRYGNLHRPRPPAGRGLQVAIADREAWYGTRTAAAGAPLDDLLSPEYNAARRAPVGDKASFELRPGSPGGRAPRARRPRARGGRGGRASTPWGR